MKLHFEPRPMTLEELTAYYLPELKVNEYSIREFKKHLLLNDVEKYLSPIKDGKSLSPKRRLSLRDVWVIIRRLGMPPLLRIKTES